jgi:hypothetical protein
VRQQHTRGGRGRHAAVRPVRLELSPSPSARADARGVSALRCLAKDHRPVGFPRPQPTGGPPAATPVRRLCEPAPRGCLAVALAVLLLLARQRRTVRL